VPWERRERKKDRRGRKVKKERERERERENSTKVRQYIKEPSVEGSVSLRQ
jgi:hypothetical protein